MRPHITADVVVVGAGVIGASTAFHLARRGQSVVVVDAFDGPAEGSTGRSFASIRAQWADALNIDMSWRSIQAYRNFPREHGVDVGYRPSGYLFVVPDKSWASHLAAVELQRERGIPVDVLDVRAAQKHTPFSTHGVGGATWGPADGVVDPHLATSAYLKLARARGATTLFRHRIDSVTRAPDGWILAAGEGTVHARQVVNAAGGWAGELAALAGLQAPVVHSRRNIYATAPNAVTKAVPMTIDLATGVFVRSEGSRLLFAAARPDQAEGYDTTVDWPWMETVLERAVDRFPWLADLPLDRTGCWAGTYENTPDHHGILGEDPTAPGWVNACGFSGHGLMQAPEIGRLAAEQIVDGVISSVDASALRLDRFTSASAAAVELVF
jgi:sarcosine oxidase subunit beta